MRIIFWCFLEKELKDLEDDFKSIFQTNSVIWDYENVWEWIMPSVENQGQWFNISRQHNWTTGEYEKPIIIAVECVDNNHQQFFGKKLSEILRCEIHEGEADFDEKKQEYILFSTQVFKSSS